MDNLIIVTDWEEVEKDDFYLSKDWEKEVEREEIEIAKNYQKAGGLYIAYIVNARDYCIYGQMDSDQVFIDSEGNIILRCETQVINTNFEDKLSCEDY